MVDTFRLRFGCYEVATANWQKAVLEAVEKVDRKLDNLTAQYNSEMKQLAVDMATLKTQVKIYAAIAAFIGMTVGGAIAKFFLK
jgi:hypothetical protein